jgi:hypothetical protein
VYQLERLPHGAGDALGGEGATVNDFKDFIVQVWKGISKIAEGGNDMEANTIKLVLERNSDDGHQDSLQVQEDIGRALQRQNKSANGLQNTKRSDALLIEEVAVLAVFSLFLVRVAQLFAKRYGKGGQLWCKDLDKVLHDVRQGIDINLVCKFQELLHDLRDVLLHVSSDDIVTDEWLE